MTLGQRIYEHRKKLGISQEMLGERLGVSRQAVSKWETDAASPDMENLLALAREFGISVAELTATPGPPQVAEPQKQPEQFEPQPRTSQSHLRWLLITAVLAVVFGTLLRIGIWHHNAVKEPTSDLTTPETEQTPSLPDRPNPDTEPSESPNSSLPSPAPKTDFALLWYGTNGDEEFLELGEQEAFFPFGTTLELTAPEESIDTDFGSMTAHRADCGAIDIAYYHITEEPERESVWSLATMVSGVRTPRGVHPGSTKAQVLDAYGDELVYCMKEDGGYTLIKHDYYYAFQTPETFGASLQFFMLDGIVAGIRVEHMAELGNTAFAPDNISRFPLKDGEPDYSQRQEPEQEILSDTRKVYIAWNQLVTNNNLSAEEQYAYRRDVFGLLPYMDWDELRTMGTAEHPDDVLFALMAWLAGQKTYSDSEILFVQMGCTAKGIDGAYAGSYGSILSNTLFFNPVAFAKALATDSVDETIKWHAMLFAAFDTVWDQNRCAQVIDTLESALSDGAFTEIQADWCRLLLLYLNTPENEMGELPRSPKKQ